MALITRITVFALLCAGGFFVFRAATALAALYAGWFVFSANTHSLMNQYWMNVIGVWVCFEVGKIVAARTRSADQPSL